MKPSLKTIAGQPSWILRSDTVELALTRQGGHMAPVTFFCDGARPVQPYYICPWAEEGRKIPEPVLEPLRGDFFCLPFGGNGTYRGTHLPVHGETAGRSWRLSSASSEGGLHALVLKMKTSRMSGQVTKTLRLKDGQNAVYCQHVLEGFSGSTSLGHHATLAVPEKEGQMQVSTSRFKLGMTNADPTGDPPAGEYDILEPRRTFKSLSRVPLKVRRPATADLTSFPAREGFTDLLGVFKVPASRPAWTAAVVASQGYLWYSLKDPALLPATLLWVSNRGRWGEPWLGRNRCLGLEDVCGYFAHGIADSVRKNLLNEKGIPTAVKLSKSRPTTVNYIQGCVAVPRTFTQVRSARFVSGGVVFTSTEGKKVEAEVDWKFLETGELG
jgi:hypothetical protein